MPSQVLMESKEMITSSLTEGGEKEPHTTPLLTNSTTSRPLESKVRLEPSREYTVEEVGEEEDEEEEYGRSTDSITPLIDGKIPTSSTAVNSDESLVTKSAFEITSVSRVPPEETEDGLQAHTSKDQDELMKSLLEARNRSSNRLSTSSAESELDYSLMAGTNGEGSPVNSEGGGEGGEEGRGGGERGRGSITITNSSSPKPPDVSVATTALLLTATNGPALQPQSRFRRVNKYVRGRWSVRDSLEPEGDPRPESEMKMAPNATNITRPPHELINTSPSIVRKQQSYIDRNHDNEIIGDELSNYMRSQSLLPLSSAPPLPPSYRDGGPAESIHSLSRTGSVSSIREHQEDLESTVSMPLSIVTPDIQTTLNLLDRPLQRCECEDCTSSISHDKSLQDYQQGLENAMSHLQNQFLLFFQASAYRSLQEERNRLAKDNERLKEQVASLRHEIETLKSATLPSHTHSDSLPPPPPPNPT